MYNKIHSRFGWAIIIFSFLVLIYCILGIFLPIVPVKVPAGFHGRNGEFCGIRYTPDCDVIVTRFFKWNEAYYLCTKFKK